jgi:hypothetical protein
LCSTRISTALIGLPTITWLDSRNNEVMSTTSSTSTLTFNPLTAAAAGMYTCRAILNNIYREETAEVMVTVQCECFFVGALALNGEITNCLCC